MSTLSLRSGTQTPPTSGRPPRVKSLTHRLVEDFQANIQRGTLRPGDRVPPEPELMRDFGVSRTVVREAMQRLQALGLVKIQQGVGTFVQAPTAGVTLLDLRGHDESPPDLSAMLELRITIETESAALAATRRTRAQCLLMAADLDDYEAHWRAGDSTVDDDFRFHLQIAEASGNAYFVRVLHGLGDDTLSHLRRGTDMAKTLSVATALQHKEQAHQEHRAILEAILRGDSAGARAAMFAHITNSRERLLVPVQHPLA